MDRAVLYRYRWKFIRIGLILALVGVGKLTHAQPAPEPLSGQKLFTRQCATCHSVAKGDSERVGPPLYAVVGRTAGKYPGFAYSPALRGSRIKWDKARLDFWLTDSNAAVPGSHMNYKQADAAKRKAIIDYISAPQ